MSVSLQQLCHRLAEIAPLSLAESWDNVGLLIGRRDADVDRAMTCLTITDAVVREALERRVHLIIAHHPFPFRPTKQITNDTVNGRRLLDLIGGGVAVYSAHTAFDSAEQGINQTWAESFSLQSIEPIIRPAEGNRLGAGRVGNLPVPATAREVIVRCGRLVSDSVICRAAGPGDRVVSRIGFACGSGGSFIDAAYRCGCELLITGEATFHQCLEAEALGMVLGLLGHYHSERYAMELLAARLVADFPELSIWASEAESDPLVYLPSPAAEL